MTEGEIAEGPDRAIEQIDRAGIVSASERIPL
jgi:hypothetical protein